MWINNRFIITFLLSAYVEFRITTPNFLKNDVITMDLIQGGPETTVEKIDPMYLTEISLNHPVLALCSIKTIHYLLCSLHEIRGEDLGLIFI